MQHAPHIVSFRGAQDRWVGRAIAHPGLGRIERGTLHYYLPPPPPTARLTHNNFGYNLLFQIVRTYPKILCHLWTFPNA